MHKPLGLYAQTFMLVCVAQELNESMRRRRVEVHEVDEGLARDYDNRLAEALRAMREENDQAIQANRAEVEDMYQRKVSGVNSST